MEPMSGDQWFMVCLALVLVGGIVATTLIGAICKAVMYWSHARYVGESMTVDETKSEVS